MWSAAIDKDRHLVEMRFAQRVTPEDAAACLQKMRELLEAIPAGFSLLTDLSELEEMDLACLPTIDLVMDALNQHGVRKVVRVIPEPEKDIGFGIMSLFHYSRKVRVVTCETLKEAQQHLPLPKA
jgi:hypothetical protein